VARYQSTLWQGYVVPAVARYRKLPMARTDQALQPEGSWRGARAPPNPQAGPVPSAPRHRAEHKRIGGCTRIRRFVV